MSTDRYWDSLRQLRLGMRWLRWLTHHQRQTLLMMLLALATGVEFLENIMFVFASSHIMGGVDADPRSFALVHWLEKMVPPAWRLGLLADHRVWLETDTRICLPITAGGLITEITRFALDLGPYLALMDETGLTIAAPPRAAN